MAYAYKVNRVTIFGNSYDGAEEWSTGFFLGQTAADVGTPNEAMAAAIKAAWATFYGAGANMFGYRWKTDGVKIAHLKTDGKTDLDNVVTSYYTTPVQGASTGIGFPPQVSVVATLLADNGRGLAGKGRMFLPGIQQGLDATGHMGSPFPQTLATNLAAMFATIESSFDVVGQLINASQGRIAIGGTAPLNRDVTHIRVGNVYDTQRRRRNQLTEIYSTDEI